MKVFQDRAAASDAASGMQFRRMTRPEILYWYEVLLPEGFAPHEIKPWADVERLLAEDRYEIWGLFASGTGAGEDAPAGSCGASSDSPGGATPAGSCGVSSDSPGGDAQDNAAGADDPAKAAECACDPLPIGFACLWKRAGIPLVLLDYLGVAARLRGGGLGARMLSQLKAQGRPMVLESEKPLPGGDEAENALRLRRIAFYERCGFAPAYEMATCGMRWQAMLAGAEVYELKDIMRWHRQLYDEKRTDVQVPLGPDETPAPPYWMEHR